MSVLSLLVAALGAVRSEAALEPVGSLPGLVGEPCFNQWSGYAKTASPDKFLFSWVVEAHDAADTKPVVLWLNGGPGCSSLGGMWTELGPYVVDSQQTLRYNPYSWNKAATMIFVEQPAGVGFSYPAMDTNDAITANDTYYALRDIFSQLPSYLSERPFYVFGESYGGHYVPNTVKAIQDGNAALATDAPGRINLKGFGVGNGYTDWALDFNMNVPYGRYHALCSEVQMEAAQEACDGNTAACFWPRDGVACSDACNAAVTTATNNVNSLDIYDIYADVCLEGERLPNQAFVLEMERRKAKTASGGLSSTPISPIFPTCADNYAATYLSRADVQEAIHARRVETWNDCGILNTGNGTASREFTYDFNYESRIPYYKDWVAQGGLDILVYSGDADYILNHMSTENWLSALELPVKRDFVTWTGSDGQVAGYLTEFEGLRFVTVKGAGHMVPKDRPGHALDLFQAFLTGTPIDAISRDDGGPLCGVSVAQTLV
jgi:cathepsin A (carboxypeptidase C)/serine carboxypeptidase-like clade 2